MTFKEKLQMEHPEKVNERFGGGWLECPDTYGYGNMEGKCTFDCKSCWDREMPNEELVKTVPLPMPPITEPKEEVTQDLYLAGLKIGESTGYNKGLNDAWELARKIWDNGDSENQRIFGTFLLGKILRELTPQEALAKLKAYEKQSKIEVGDIVANDKEEIQGLVLDFDSADPCVWVLTENQCVEEWDMCDIKKTDKHIDIKSILEQIGE